MIFRNLDSLRDWAFGQGRQNYISGNPAIGLNIETRILSWVGDCFFDMIAGIDWLTRLGRKGQQPILEGDLRRIILTSYGVTGINSFSISVVGRSFSAEYDISTIFSASYKGTISKVFSNA